MRLLMLPPSHIYHVIVEGGDLKAATVGLSTIA